MKPAIVIIIISVLFSACKDKNSRTVVSPREAVRIDNHFGECPYLTKDNKGNTVLSWIRMINDSTTALCYAISKDGSSFSEPVTIPNTGNIQPHGENLPKVIFTPSGEIMALWGIANPNPDNEYSGLVLYTQSFDNGKTWTAVKPLVSDSASYDQRYFDVAVLRDGTVGVVWLDNRTATEKEGSGLYFAVCRGRKGFEVGKLIAQPCCQCCRTDLYADTTGDIHVLFRGIIQDSIRDILHIVSEDNGNTFSAPKRISEDNWVINGCPHTGPSMTENKEGMHVAWFTGGTNKGCYYTKSNNGGRSFAMHDRITLSGSHPQITSLPNGELLIAWDENTYSSDKTTKRIGVQGRTADGRREGKTYISSMDADASFPVISALNSTSALVAYTVSKNHRSYVTYQVVRTR